MISRVLAGAGILAFLVAAAPLPPDPFLWLESVHGARATAWVKTENAKTLAVLKADPHFAAFDADAFKVNSATDRIPFARIINGEVYNFWRDAEHVRGIWRKTSIADYNTPMPTWTTVLDLDALAKSEGKNWVWHGAHVSPDGSRALISLSEGGEDASTDREFDLKTATFVPDGFVLPRGKQNATWENESTLLVSREWTPGELTASGYAYDTRRLKRGQPLADATEVFSGEKSDVSSGPESVRDGQGHRVIFIRRGVSFFQSEESIFTPQGLKPFPIPKKSSVQGMVDGHMLVSLDEPWTTGGRTFAQGSLVSLELADVLADPAHLKATLVYAPGPRESLQGVGTTRDHLVITTTDNVRGRVAVYTPSATGTWSKQTVKVPDNLSIDLSATNDEGTEAYITATGFLTPPSLLALDTVTGATTVVKSQSAKFDAANDVVEQFEATSTDGTKIPYFVVHPKHMKRDGKNPTILYAYGGFQVSLTPNYNPVLGKLWLEHGGVYVLANIRGGGEFGPAWHEAGLKTKRQIIYDDFASVARDLMARKITSPRRLGIQGGSNGGLLMGVEFTQHPELWHAVDIQVPLLDMLRFEQIEAGASWVGEYGSVSIPAQRAFLAKISPYNNLHANVTYPEPFIWTTTKDDRVGPEHARKFAAKLASMHKPYLFYEVTEGGHGAGANIAESSMTEALEYTYFTRKLMQ